MAAASGAFLDSGQALYTDAVDPATRASVSSTFYINHGSGTTLALVTQTGLVSENAETRTVATVTQPVSQRLRFTATLVMTGTRVLNEYVVFDALTGGTAIARVTAGELNYETGDQVTVDIDVNLRDGTAEIAFA